MVFKLGEQSGEHYPRQGSTAHVRGAVPVKGESSPYGPCNALGVGSRDPLLKTTGVDNVRTGFDDVAYRVEAFLGIVGHGFGEAEEIGGTRAHFSQSSVQEPERVDVVLRKRAHLPPHHGEHTEKDKHISIKVLPRFIIIMGDWV